MFTSSITSQKNLSVLGIALACLLFLLPVGIPFVDACGPANVVGSCEDNAGNDPVGRSELPGEEIVFADWIKATGASPRRCGSIPALQPRHGSHLAGVHPGHSRLPLGPRGAAVPTSLIPIRC
jgi:hypothetical protein